MRVWSTNSKGEVRFVISMVCGMGWMLESGRARRVPCLQSSQQPAWGKWERKQRGQNYRELLECQSACANFLFVLERKAFCFDLTYEMMRSMAFRRAQLGEVFQAEETLEVGRKLISPGRDSTFIGLCPHLLAMKSWVVGMGLGLSTVFQPCGTWWLQSFACSPGSFQMLLI